MLSKPVTVTLGLNRSLLFGLCCFCIYLLANIYTTYGSLLVAAAIGGAGGAILWTATGTYITQSAILYSSTQHYSYRAILGTFNSIFFFCLQCALVTLQFSSSLVLSNGNIGRWNRCVSSTGFAIHAACVLMLHYSLLNAALVAVCRPEN